MSDKKWYRLNNSFSLTDTGQVQPRLGPGVYALAKNPISGALYLERTKDSFTFPYKLYDIKEDFIAWAAKTYANTTTSLGIIFNGTSGAGKTVTAKLLCNALGLPVVTVSEPFAGIGGFLCQVPDDIVVLIDEYEKVFASTGGHLNRVEGGGNFSSQEDLLAAMDGVASAAARRVWLMTTNHLRISNYLLDRPGRIRYVVEFDGLKEEVIREVLQDCLPDTSLIPAAVDYLSTLERVSIDIVKAVALEMSIHNCAPSEFRSFFNAAEPESSGYYELYTRASGAMGEFKLVHGMASFSGGSLRAFCTGDRLMGTAYAPSGDRITFNLGVIESMPSQRRKHYVLTDANGLNTEYLIKPVAFRNPALDGFLI